MNVETSPLVSIKEAAATVGTCENTIRNWIAQGTLPALRVGGKLIRIRTKDLAAIIHPVGEQKC